MIAALTRLASRYSHVNWALADQAMVSGVNFLTGILLARYLGIEEFGRFTLAWMVVLFAASIQHAAINAPMMSIGAKQEEEDAPAYYAAVFAQQAVFAALSIALVFAGATAVARGFPDWKIDGLALPLAAAATAYQVQDFLRRYFFTRGRAGTAFATDAIRYLGQLVLLVWLFVTFNAMNSSHTLWAISSVTILAATGAAFLVEPVRWVPDVARRVSRRHGQLSKWLLPSALMQFATTNVFFIVTGTVLGVTAVGALKAAQNLIGITHILFQGLENVVPSRAARLLEVHGVSELNRYLTRVWWVGALITGAICSVFALFPDFWFGLIFGEEFLGYGHIVRLYAIVYLFVFSTLPLISGLRALEHTKPIFHTYALASCFSLLMSYPLISTLGLTGVLIGLILMNFFIFIFLYTQYKRFIHRR